MPTAFGPTLISVRTPVASVASRASAGVVALQILVVMVLFRTVGAASELSSCPTNCSCLGNMVDCSKRRLKRVPDLPVWVQILDVSSNSITNVNDNHFKGLTDLEEINLSNNKLGTFNSSILHQLPKIHHLKLSHNRLSQIPEINFATNITHLILSHNLISHVNVSPPGNLENLRVIDLSFNAITHIKNGTMSSFRNLHHLFLMDNRIQSVDQGVFDNLTSLEWLKLNKNRLTSLPPNIFIRLQKLKYLELNQNRLTKIEGLRFQGLGNLLSLRLRRNHLSELMDGAFWGLSKIQTLQLDYNNLTKISSRFLFGLETMEHLSLTHNLITHIEPDSWSSCKRLTELDLSHNHLSAVTELMFTRLEALQTLKLNHNKILYIAEDAFQDLIMLKTLDLSHNQLSSTLEDAGSVFSSLASLTSLSLDGNDIKSIAKHTLKGLNHLKQLNLLGNSITSIQDNAFEPLKNLKQLRFNSTYLLCDCLLSWLPIWLRGTGFQVHVHAQCAHPEPIRGLSILEVNGTSFKCDDFPKPIIVKDPKSQIALKDGILNLTCTATTSSDSEIRIEWKKDHMILSNALVENTARSNTENGLVEFTSQLTLFPVKNEHAGHYQCVVSNVLGTSYSTKAEITVGVYPRFTKLPGDVTVKAGSTARLECAASGQPTPEIAWQKDGGDDFPAARERRMHVMPSDDVFFIVEVKSEDQGIYTCTAKNDAGFIKANATLTVLQAPSFAKTSREKVAAEGETAVLECMSSRPGGRPRLEWLKDGRPLLLTSRHYFAADGQLLVIVKTQSSDSGEYTCIMTNSLGSERATSHFTVMSSSPFSLNLKSHTTATNQTDDLTRIGIIVVVVVVCIVGTSLIWVIVIYRLRLRKQLCRSTKTEKTTPHTEMMSTSFHGTEDSFVAGQHSSPHLWPNTRCDATSESCSLVIHGTKRIYHNPAQKCSPGVDFYLYNSCRCQDSGCFCTDSKSNEKSSQSQLHPADHVAPRAQNCWFPPVIEGQERSTLSMPELSANSVPISSAADVCHSLEVAVQKPEIQQSTVSNCYGWHTASDSDLSSTGNRCQLCRNNLLCQKGQAQPDLKVLSHLLENVHVQTGGFCENYRGMQGPVAVDTSFHSHSHHKQLVEALPVPNDL